MRSLHSLTLIRVVSLLCIPFALQGDQNAPPWEDTTKVGRALYRENCIVCHDIEKRETQKLGPSLFRLFQNELGKYVIRCAHKNYILYLLGQ